MSTFTAIEVDKLPAPDIFEQRTFESIYAERLAEFRRLCPDFSAIVESDPVIKLLQASAYREMLLREQFNQRARGVMLPFSQGGDLDNLAVPYGVQRKLVVPADPEAGTPARYESDEDFRRRIQLGPEGFSVAGPEGAYVFHALSADPRVLDASATSPAPGEVVVSVLSREADGTATQGLLDIVEAKLSADDVRPLTDHVLVKPATIVTYSVDATLFTFAGPDSQVVLAEARTRLDRYISESHRLGRDVTRSGLFAALHAEGVQRVEIVHPAADVVVDRTQATHCAGVTLTHGGTDE